MSPSYYHAYLSSRLMVALASLKTYSIFSKLTLQIEGKDFVPDACLYPKKTMNFASQDILKSCRIPYNSY
jgi:hypothetical protein